MGIFWSSVDIVGLSEGDRESLEPRRYGSRQSAGQGRGAYRRLESAVQEPT
jgi:hypothetical protein